MTRRDVLRALRATRPPGVPCPRWAIRETPGRAGRSVARSRQGTAWRRLATHWPAPEAAR